MSQPFLSTPHFKEAEIQLDVLLKMSPHLLAVTNEHGQFLFLNQEWENVLGKKLKDLLGTSCFDLMYFDKPSELVSFKKFFNAHKNKISKRPHFNKYTHKDGSLVSLEWCVHKLEKKYYCVVRDITQEKKRKKIETELQRIGKIGWWVVDVSKNSVAWSEEVFRIHGVKSKGNPAVPTALNYYPGAAKKIISQLVERGIKKGIAWDVELPFRSKDKKNKWVHTTGYPVYDKNGKVVELFGVFQDITHEKIKKDQLQSHFNKMMENSQLAILGEIATGIAHEVNNPLAIIQSNAERILQRLKQDTISVEDIKLQAQRTLQMISRISDIVSGLKSLTRFDNEPFEKRSLRSILQETGNMISLKAKSKRVELIFPILLKDISIRCRSVQVEQVLLNLLANSIDAIQHLKKKWIRVEVQTKKTKILISIIDPGPGIPSEIRAKILEPFFTTKPYGKGTGLGLSISRRIIREHGGDLYLDSKKTYTTFIVELPAV